ncbi:MAG: HD domain-containing protein [Euryarchaeota archaeon]|nr:HD domain-containing protein [Euryarchaeota archaeon]
MKFIRDSIHGDIFLTQVEFEIVDTPEFQRLRRLKQLGMTYLVYPSANHTRFEHSLGALHLAGRVAGKLGLSEEDKKKIRIAALLHDVGHGPLSHTSEELLERYLNKSHERITGSIIRNSSISTIIERHGIEKKDITKLLQSSKIISGEFDVDRMDFLVRDAHHTGVGYGIIDLDRLINTMQIFKGELVVEEGGLKAVEALLVARFLMIPTVYLHHTSRIADAMFLRATERAIEEGLLRYEMLYKMDDYDVQNLFRNASGYVRDIGERFDERKLFKKACSKGWHELDAPLRDRLLKLRGRVEKLRKLEDEIAGDCKVASGYVLLDVPPLPYKEMRAFILRDGKLLRLEEASPLVKILNEAQKEQWDVAIYTPKERVEKVSKVELEDYV